MHILMMNLTDKWQDWEALGFPSRTAAVARYLGKHPHVDGMLVINVPYSLAGYLAGRVARRTGSRWRNDEAWIDSGALFRLRKVEVKTFVMDHLRLLPRERHNPHVFSVNSKLFDHYLVRAVRRALRRLGMERPVLWLTGPLLAKHIGCFDESLVVYDAADEWMIHPDYASMRRHYALGYEAIRRQAGVVFAQCEELADVFRGGKPSVYVIGNGIDADVFFARPTRVPLDLVGVSHPIVGYVGNLQQRVDVQLIERVARSMRHVSFVFVGPVVTPRHFRSIAELENVWFMGEKNHLEIPAYLAAFDACIVPHIASEFTQVTDPVKIYEYLAAGKPVVASDVRLPVGSEALVRHCLGETDFALALREALDGRWGPDLDKARIFVEARTWANRVNEMVHHLEAADHAKAHEAHPVELASHDETLCRSSSGTWDDRKAIRC